MNLGWNCLFSLPRSSLPRMSALAHPLADLLRAFESDAGGLFRGPDDTVPVVGRREQSNN